MQDVVKRALRSGFAFKYDVQDRKRALKVLSVVERQSAAVAPAVRRQAEQYAASVLGSKRFTPWLLVYAAMAGEFRDGWLPDNFYGRVVVPNLNHALRYVADLKSFTRLVFRSDAIPDTGYLINGRFYDRDHRELPLQHVRDIVFDGCEAIIFKSDSSRQGKGVFTLNRSDFEPEAFASEHGNAAFQRLIVQHPFFDGFSPGGGTTIRVTTVRTLGADFEARAAYIRFPGTDQATVASASHVRVAIDLGAGSMAESGYLSDWSRVDRHPGSTNRFERVGVPAMERVVQRCVSMHEGVPHVGVIGWDVMVDADENVWIIEWNAKHNDIKFSEATSGPCFAGLGWERLRPVDGTWHV